MSISGWSNWLLMLILLYKILLCLIFRKFNEDVGKIEEINVTLVEKEKR